MYTCLISKHQLICRSTKQVWDYTFWVGPTFIITSLLSIEGGGNRNIVFLGSKIWQFYFIRHPIHSKEKVEWSLKIDFKILVVISVLGSPLSSKKCFSLSVWCCVVKTKILDRFLQNLQKTKKIKDLGYYKCRRWLHCVNKPPFWPKNAEIAFIFYKNCL